VCGFFRGKKERDDILFAFIREGLRSGAKCLCAFEATDRNAQLAEVSVQVEASTGDQLDVILSRELYLGRGDFSFQDMIDYWESWATAALVGSGFSVACAVGEMTPAVIEVIGPANLIRYESALNRFAPRYPQVLLCLYDLDKVRGDLLIDLMRTHPMVLLGSTVLENRYYVPPGELAGAPP
jgi:hypothetical protein